MNKYLSFLFRTILFSILLFICMAFFSALLNKGQTASSSGSAVSALIVYSFLNAAGIALWFEYSSLTGLTLFSTCFTLFWGVQYFMTQIETLFFNDSVKMPLSELFRIVLSGALYIAAFSFLAIWIFSRFHKKSLSDSQLHGIPIQIHGLFSRFIILTLLYVIIYFFFGYFVAWQFPAIRQFYSGSTRMISFWQDMAEQNPVLVLFQVFRGVLWAFLSLLIQRSLKKEKRAAQLLLPGLLFSILITTPLLFPNSYMPDAVRFGHAFELSGSMFFYGLLGAFILDKKSSPLH